MENRKYESSEVTVISMEPDENLMEHLGANLIWGAFA